MTPSSGTRSTRGHEVSLPPPGSLCRVRVGGEARVGVLTSSGVVLTELASPLDAVVEGRLDPGVAAAVEAAARPLAVEDLEFLPPVEPRTMLYAGRNYEDHLAENPRPRAAEPVLFSKLVSSIVGHMATVRISPAQHADYEGELALVIGAVARRVRRDDALAFVAGFTIANDVSDRAVQHVNNQITMGKGADTFGPLGPWLVPRELVGDASGLRIRTWVNDDLRQDGTTSDLIHDVADCIAAATRTVTLQPGDVIATGTPAGTGAYRDPPAWLQPGDVVTVEIEGLGALINPVDADPDG
jgi:2-keto-4-pentenoate hydratase/2-oxohepta-3-ene-1,7-dioic acid hydratase in catechol pathway